MYTEYEEDNTIIPEDGIYSAGSIMGMRDWQKEVEMLTSTTIESTKKEEHILRLKAIKVNKKREWKYVVNKLLDLGFDWMNELSNDDGYNGSKNFNKNDSNYIAYDTEKKVILFSIGEPIIPFKEVYSLEEFKKEVEG